MTASGRAFFATGDVVVSSAVDFLVLEMERRSGMSSLAAGDAARVVFLALDWATCCSDSGTFFLALGEEGMTAGRLVLLASEAALALVVLLEEVRSAGAGVGGAALVAMGEETAETSGLSLLLAVGVEGVTV